MDVELMTPIVIGSIPLKMGPSSVQPTFHGQSVVPAIDYQPVHVYSDVQVVSGNFHQNTAEYPPSNGFSYGPPPQNFNQGPYAPSTAPYDQRKKQFL